MVERSPIPQHTLDAEYWSGHSRTDGCLWIPKSRDPEYLRDFARKALEDYSKRSSKTPLLPIRGGLKFDGRDFTPGTVVKLIYKELKLGPSGEHVDLNKSFSSGIALGVIGNMSIDEKPTKVLLTFEHRRDKKIGHPGPTILLPAQVGFANHTRINGSESLIKILSLGAPGRI